MIATHLLSQGNDEARRQIIDGPQSGTETSCTGMSTFAFISGVKNGWLPARTYIPAARNVWIAPTSGIDDKPVVREAGAGSNHNSCKLQMKRTCATGDLPEQTLSLWLAFSIPF